MTLLLDIRGADWVHEARSRAFRQKLALNPLVDWWGDDPFTLYDFQDSYILLGAINKGTSGFLGNMAWDHAGIESGNAWYTYPVPGAIGRGMNNDGGVGGHYGSVVNHSGNNMSNQAIGTFHFVFYPRSAGEGGNGTLIQMDECYRVRFSAANTISAGVWNGAAWVDWPTQARVWYNAWNILTVSFDLAAGGANYKICMYLNGFQVQVPGAAPPVECPSCANILYVLDNADNNAAFDGILGALYIHPAMFYTLGEAQDLLIECRGLFQPTAANQPDILVPGTWGKPDYRFAMANNDHLYSFQATPLKTEEGTVLIDFVPQDMANEQLLYGITEEGSALEDELIIALRGDIVGDAIELMRRTDGATDLRLSIPFGAGRLNVPSRVAFTSDGTTVRGFLDGEEQVVSAVVGANTGQWFDSAEDADVVCVGKLRSAAAIGDLSGLVSEIVVYDRALAPIEIQQWVASGKGPRGARRMPER